MSKLEFICPCLGKDIEGVEELERKEHEHCLKKE